MTPTTHSRRVMLGILAALPVAAASPLRAQGALSGDYRVSGRNPDGSAYSGTVRVTEAAGAVSMFWQVGSQTYSGSGFREGRIVTVNWGDTTPVVYVIMPDGEWHGTWSDGTALEKLTR